VTQQAEPQALDLDLDAIDDRANAATPGPWKAVQLEGFGAENFIVTLSQEHQPKWYRVVAYIGNAGGFKGNDFIAHAREDVPKLTAEVRRLRAALATAEAQLHAIDDEAPKEGA